MIRITLTLALLLTGIMVFSQPRKKQYSAGKNSQQSKFLEKQWWLGFKAGVNLTDTDPLKRYAIITPTNYQASLLDKQYESYGSIGTQATLEATFYIKGFSISTQPTYRNSKYIYSNELQWRNPDNTEEYLILSYQQEQKVDYFDMPLILKYDILKGNLRPYVQAGIYYSFLINANKEVTVQSDDYASGGVNTNSNEPISIGAKDLFSSYWGLMAGAGVNYNLGNVRVVLDASYWKGMSNITNTDNRYNNDRLSGIGEAQDDLKLNNIVISLGVLFPMRFLSNSFNTLD
jgi:hypothetical protein